MNQADDETSKVDNWEEGAESTPQNVTIAGFSPSVKLEENLEQSPWFFTPRVGSTSLPTTFASCLHPITMSQNGKVINQLAGQQVEMSQNYVEENEVNEVENFEGLTEFKGRRRSEVWKDFTVEKKSDGSLWARCKYCKKLLTAKSNSGTGHLQRHVKNHCVKKANRDLKQIFVSFSPKESTGDTKDFKFNQDVSRRDLAKMMICAELPFSIVEIPVFINFVKNLQPSFQIGDQSTVRNDCLALYDEEKQRVRDMLANLNSRVSLTFDLWTSSEKLGYIALTAHFINEDFILMKKMLNFRRIASPQTSHVINNEIAKCIIEWGLNEKLFSLTLNNCTTNDILVTRFRENWSEKLKGSGNYLHIRCCSHILNSMGQDGMEVIHFAIEHIRNIIIYVITSPSRMHVFNEIAQQCGLDTRKGLTIDVSKKWNDTYDMLQSALLCKEAFIRYAKVHYHSTDAPTSDDWEKVEFVMKILKAFWDATNVLSGARHPSANLYFKEVWGIRQLLSKEVTNCDEVVRDVILEMQKKFKKYWNECNMILAIASILDPRFKCLFVQYCYEKAFGEEEARQRVDEIRDCLYNLYNDYEKEPKAEKPAESKSSSGFSGGSSTLEYTSKRKLEMEFEAFLSQNIQKRPKRNELDAYLNDDLFPTMGDEDFSVLTWWKNNASVYPILSRMARDVLAIPVSTIAFESAFSSCARLIDQCGSSLASSMVEALICVHDWFHDDYNGDANPDLHSSNIADEDLFESCLAE